MTREIDEQTAVGEVYMRSLVSTQLRLAFVVLGVVVVLIGGLPALFAFVPALREAHALGIPLPWLLLAGLIYPGLAALGWFYVRHAERTERDFSDLVEH